MNAYFPIFINLKNKNVLIAGGGRVAYQKIKNLLPFDAAITVISPEFTDELIQLAVKEKKVKLQKGKVEDIDFKDFDLIISAVNNKKINASCVKKGRKLKIWVNSVDDPENCDFITASVIKRKNVVIAVSSGGFLPGLSKILRKIIDAYLPENHFQYFTKIFQLRSKLKKKIKNQREREETLKEIVKDIERRYF
ncbi:MAG: bifunctional precorrin-2 dehydrogenase/sirohydrochlorin ferrochelatase [Spirochaetia bacterium]|nr:bifunctional precorrin-2 dehydrogenase/sirohydrochlorin ferrochelatase [Spirochaetia bacterium]